MSTCIKQNQEQKLKMPMRETCQVLSWSDQFNIRELKQIATAGAATPIVVEEVWGEYVAVARQNST